MIYTLSALLAAVLLALDQWVKHWTVAHFAAPVPPQLYWTADPARPLLPGIVELTRVHNYGAAWSSFSGRRWLLVGLTACILLAVLAVLVRRIVRHPLGVVSCCLILAGGLGNILDRLRLGYVVDMLHLQFWPSYPVFNVADICVVCGAVLGAVYFLRFYEKYDKRPGREGREDAHGDADAADR